MYNPDAYSDCEKQIGRREDKPFIGPVAPSLCPACATKHGEQQCWGHQCTCSCNQQTGHISTAEIYAQAGVPFGESLRRCADALKQIETSLAPHLEPVEMEELADEPGPQIENFFGADRYV